MLLVVVACYQVEWRTLVDIAPGPLVIQQPGTADSPRKWAMISYGTDEAGLGWHAHGPTWLGIVTGLKKWFLYPPGEASVARVGHPFASAREWP